MDSSLTAKQIRQMFLDFFIKKVVMKYVVLLALTFLCFSMSTSTSTPPPPSPWTTPRSCLPTLA